jgi:hypothetical protein
MAMNQTQIPQNFCFCHSGLDPESSGFSEYFAAGCRIGPVLNLIGDPA